MWTFIHDLAGEEARAFRLEILAGLRGAEWSTAIVLMTAYADAETRAEALRLGVDAFFEKPFDIDDLVPLVINLTPSTTEQRPQCPGTGRGNETQWGLRWRNFHVDSVRRSAHGANPCTPEDIVGGTMIGVTGAPEAPAAQLAPMGGMGQPRILIVDDDPSLLQALALTLGRGLDGAVVEICDSPIQALRDIAANDYDVVVSDVLMGGMHGLELLERVRVIRPATLVVLITGAEDRDLAVRA